VIQHGFGGAKLGDIVHYAEPLVTDYAPRAVVVFAGSNDLRPGATRPPSALLHLYELFVERVRAELPNVPIYYIGITPSPRRWEIWDVAQETNAKIRAWTEQDPFLFYIETGPALMGEDGAPDADNYRLDGLHLSGRGYEIWTDIIRPRLLEDLAD
jgi:lysophospholipase L1-like esterase